jgi:hypothetical protein
MAKKKPRRLKNQTLIAKRKRARKAGKPSMIVYPALTVAVLREMVRQLKAVEIKPDARGYIHFAL